jgi:outer membrane protein assembly factor BamB
MRSRLALAVLLALSLAGPGIAVPGQVTGDWYVSGGGDMYRSGYNPGEQPPYFVRGGRRAIQPNPEWVTKLSDFPSGVFPAGGIIVAEGLVIVTGAATNSLVALNQETGLPVWRFQPDPRGSRYMPGDGHAGAYPGLNHPHYEDGVVYVTFSNGTLYALDAGSGERRRCAGRWRRSPAITPSSIPP